jgi:HEPN domain-containing protein/predicted nucleotidyltransferase
MPDLAALQPVLRRLIDVLHPEEIWLIGSRAENRAREQSDYDLLAVLPDGATDKELDPIDAWKLVSGLGVPVDVIPCTRAEFDEEKDELDSLPRAAYTKGLCVFMSIEKRTRAYLDLVDQDLQAADVLAKAHNRYAAYHCQQAVEKLLKAMLLNAGKEVGIEHRLDVLLARFDDDPHGLVTALRPFEKYTPFATAFRYPTPGGRIPAPPAFDDVLADIVALRGVLGRAKSDLLAASAERSSKK